MGQIITKKQLITRKFILIAAFIAFIWALYIATNGQSDLNNSIISCSQMSQYGNSVYEQCVQNAKNSYQAQQHTMVNMGVLAAVFGVPTVIWFITTYGRKQQE